MSPLPWLSTLTFLAVLFIATPAGAAETIPPAPGPVQPTSGGGPRAALLPAVRRYLEGVQAQAGAPPADRLPELDRLAAYLASRLRAGQPARVVAICTHNSRRSHLWQLLGAAAADFHGLRGVETYSGGTEVTAFNARAVAALERAGFALDRPAGDNPRYQARFASGGPPAVAFSKKYDDAPNPTKDFAAVMTCSQADAACPIVRGAAVRVRLPHQDPKLSDGTPAEAATYDERTRQIALEALYVFGQVARALGS